MMTLSSLPFNIQKIPIITGLRFCHKRSDALKDLTDKERKLFLNVHKDYEWLKWSPIHGSTVDDGPPPSFSKKSWIKENKMLYEEAKRFFRDWKYDYFNEQNAPQYPGLIEKVFTFEAEDSTKYWAHSSDSDLQFGYSTCNVEKTPHGTLLFSGNLCTRLPNDGTTKRSGLCAMRSPRKMKYFGYEDFYDWGPYNHLVLKIRGDGRNYVINFGQDNMLDYSWYDVHSYFVFTRGGPYWQTVKIPFSKLFSGKDGRIKQSQYEFEPHNVSHVGLTLQDGIDGPFSLEIEYIGVLFDNNHQEENAYESYDHKYVIPQ